MLTKQRGGEKRERWARIVADAHPSVSGLCSDNFDRLRLSGPPPPQRPASLHFVVVLSVPGGRRGDRVGDVPVFALNNCHQ